MVLIDCVIVIGIHYEALIWGQEISGRFPIGLVYRCDNSSRLAGNTKEMLQCPDPWGGCQARSRGTRVPGRKAKDQSEFGQIFMLTIWRWPE